VAGPEVFAAASGSATFSGLDEAIPAATTAHWLVSADLSGRAAAGETLRLSILFEDDVQAEGDAGLSVRPRGAPVDGGGLTVVERGRLTVAEGAAGLADGSERSDAASIPMLQLSLRGGAAGSEDVVVDALELAPAGTLDPRTALAADGAVLVHDADGDGRVSAGDVVLGRSAADPDDAGIGFADLRLVVPAAGFLDVLVTYDLNGTPAQGETFSLALARDGDLVARGAVSAGPVPVGGAPVAGPERTVDDTGSLAVAPGPREAPVQVVADASDVALLQLRLVVSSAEDVRISELGVQASGTADEAVDVVAESLRLFEDRDASGSVSPGDVQLAGGRSFEGDDGPAVFDGLDEVIVASSVVHWLLVADLAGSASAGEQLVAEVDRITAVGVGSDQVIEAAGLPAVGSPRTAVEPAALTVTAGPAAPEERTLLNDARGVVMLQVRLAAGAAGTEDVLVTALPMTASGTADAVGGILPDGIRLYRDTDSDGVVDPGEPRLATALRYPADNGTLVLGGLAERVPAAEQRDYLVVHDLSGRAAGGSTLAVGVPADQLVAAGAVRGEAVAAQGGLVQGAAATLVGPGGLRLAPGPNSPEPRSVDNDETDAVLLQLRLGGGDAGTEAVRVDSVALTAAGSGDDVGNVRLDSLRLYRDLDGDGAVTEEEPLLAGGLSFDRDDGTATFVELGLEVQPTEQVDLLAVLDLDGSAGPGATFEVALEASHDVGARGALSGRPVAPSGRVPIAGGRLTVGGGVGIVATPGPANPPDSSEAAGAQALPMLQLQLTNTTGVAATLGALSVVGRGAGDEQVGVARARLYHDLNADGAPGLADIRLTADQVFDEDDGALDFAPLGLALPPGEAAALLVVFDLAEQVPDGATFVAEVGDAAGVSVQAAGGGELPIFGLPLAGGVKTIEARGSLALLPGPRGGIEEEVPTDEQRVVVLSLALDAGSAEDVVVESVVFRARGSVHEVDDVSAVRLYHDVDRSGTLGLEDTQIGDARQYAADDGAVVFEALDQTLAAGTRTVWLLTYDLTGTAAVGATLGAALQVGFDLVAAGGQSGEAVVPAGAPVAGPDILVGPPIDGDDDGFERADDCNDEDPLAFPGADERCGNGEDDDCDDEIDEGFGELGAPCWRGEGECRREGLLECGNDGLSVVCAAGLGAPVDERCGNELDDDCDGEIDEGFGLLGAACEAGVGACAVRGAFACAAGVLACDAVPGEPGLEMCGDEVDNDCDASIDEGDCIEGLRIERSANPSATVARAYVYDDDLRASAAGPGPLTWSKVSGPAPLEIDAETGRVRWTPAAAGTVEIELAVANAASEDRYRFAVEVAAQPPEPPVAHASVTPEAGPAPLRVTLDGRGSTAAEGVRLTAWRWEFPESEMPARFGEVIALTLGEPGRYAVELTVLDEWGGSATDQLEVLVREGEAAPPTAAIVADPPGGDAPLTVALSCRCSPGAAPIVAWDWDFGDGSRSEEEAPTHVFAAGRFMVRLTVAAEDGLTARAEVELEVEQAGNRPPMVMATASPSRGEAPLEVTLAGQAIDVDGEILAVRWELPESRVDEAETLWRLETPGEYEATFVATDDGGLEGRRTLRVVVTEADPDVPPTEGDTGGADAASEDAGGEPPGSDAGTGAETDDRGAEADAAGAEADDAGAETEDGGDAEDVGDADGLAGSPKMSSRGCDCAQRGGGGRAGWLTTWLGLLGGRR